MAQKIARIHERQQNQPIGKSGHRQRQPAKTGRRFISIDAFRNRLKLNKGPWPAIGAAVAGGVGISAAAVIGVGELALGLAAGYAAYRMLREGIRPAAALRQVVKPPQSESSKEGIAKQS
jgi:hypothetical protein